MQGYPSVRSELIELGVWVFSSHNSVAYRPSESLLAMPSADSFEPINAFLNKMMQLFGLD
ncbi:hypothetical protein MGWOODY_Tha1772 [hydrothermal vent metagenome]|jgi:hypothetical protein|uniref:Uncharacterized protein n=1 Tax=hydrothermal vent metagenome TaxID=652676 RepID=A0A160TBZ2_9ZZZZ